MLDPTVDESTVSPTGASPGSRRRFLFVPLATGLLAALIASIITAVAVGTVSISFSRVARIIFHHLVHGAAISDWTAAEDQIVWVFRLPRALLASVVGMGLAVSGAALQAVARNPLADPYIFGISAGASVGAVLCLTLGSPAIGGVSLATGAFVGALSAAVLVYLLAHQGGRASPTRLVLAGVASGCVLSAITSFLVLHASGPGGGAAGILHWLAGSFGTARWEHLGLPSLVMLLSITYLLAKARQLNALLAGDETAVGLGGNVECFRLQLFVLTSLLVGVVVAVSGAIGFVGLIAPHVARMLVGSDYTRSLPIVALLGGVSMSAADLVGRTVLAPIELPVGIVTAAVGGPFFLWILRCWMGPSKGASWNLMRMELRSSFRPCASSKR